MHTYLYLPTYLPTSKGVLSLARSETFLFLSFNWNATEPG